MATRRGTLFAPVALAVIAGLALPGATTPPTGSASPSPSPSSTAADPGTLTATPTISAEAPSPMASGTPMPTTTPDPTPDPRYPRLRATIGVHSWFGCDRVGPNGACFSDVDDRDLTFAAEFDGAHVTGSYADGPIWWSLELPGTASVIGPGGSVRARITAAPAEVFRVLDVECFVFDVELWDERRVPATVEGNGVVLEFDVAATEDDPQYSCTFTFDPEGLPRFPPSPEPPRAPLTAVVEAVVLQGPIHVGRPDRVLSGWRFEPDFGDATVVHSRPTTGGDEEPAMWDLDLVDDSTPAVLRVLPPPGFGVRSVACYLDDSDVPWPTRLVGNRLSFELVQAATWCTFIAGPALPSTDAIGPPSGLEDDVLPRLFSLVLVGALPDPS